MPARAKIHAVLFDFDGVLVDSENLHVAAWERTLHRMACDVTAARCAVAAERDDRRFLAELMDELKIEDADLDGWVAVKQAIAGPLFEDGAAAVHAGVGPLIERLKERGLRLGIVSGSRRVNIEAALRASGLFDDFEIVIAKDDLSERKPDAGPYLRALEGLRLKPSQVVALEDSPDGLASALGAGLRVVAVGHGRREPGEWTGGAPFLAGFEPLDATLEALGLTPARNSERGTTQDAR